MARVCFLKNTTMRLGIYGAGAFGTALALSFYKAGFHVAWLCYDALEAERINEQKSNSLKIDLPAGLQTSSKADFSGLDVLLWVTPSQVVQSAFLVLRDLLPSNLPIVLCSKGLLNQRFLHEVVGDIVPNPLLAMAGPNLALEIGQGLPAETILAASHISLAKDIAASLSHPLFVISPSDDLLGIELCGTLKNIYAIGAGIIIGKEQGANAHAAFLAKSLGEMILIGQRLGAKPETFLTIAGIGDLILTGSQVLSRNMSFGIALGRGEKAHDILQKRSMVTEGFEAARNIFPLVEHLHVPLLKEIYARIFNV